MIQIFSKNKIVLSLLIPFLLFVGIVLLVKSSFFGESGRLTLAISADLLFTVPFIYFLLIRKTKIPNTTVVPVMIFGLLLGSYFLPISQQSYLSMFKTWVHPLVELVVISFVILKVRKVFKLYKDKQQTSPDFFTVLKNTTKEILPRPLVTPFSTEIALVYYGFLDWRKPKITENQFTYHKNSGTPALLGTVILITVVETFAAHILLGMWNETIAWIATGLSVYTGFQLFGFARSLAKRPMEIGSEELKLKYGIMSEAEIPFKLVESIELSRKELEDDPFHKTFSPLGELESHNVILHLKTTHSFVGLYGFRKKFTKLALCIDNAQEFVEKVNAKLDLT